MTNRQWLIWQLIDMSDEEFADRVCGNSGVWSCDECIENKRNGVCGRNCQENFHEWLKQEHKECRQ
jgi:hypothetical protein